MHAHARSFPEELADATMVYNSVPHITTNYSPNWLMFGTELTLPGWQGFKRDAASPKLRVDSFRLEKLRSQAQAQMGTDRRLKEVGPDRLQPGEWVIYKLSDYKQSAYEDQELSAKQQARWSLPALVKKVQASTCTVGPWGDFANVRQVPYTQVRKLTGKVPPSLARENLAHIEAAAPKKIRH